MTSKLKISSYSLILLLVVSYGLQRASFFDFYGMSLAPADFLLVGLTAWFLRRTSVSHLIIVCLVLAWLISLALLNFSFGLNAIITISLKIFLALSFFSLLKNVKPTKMDLILAQAFFYSFFFLILFGIEDNSFTSLGVFNVNEGVNYLLVLWFLCLVLKWLSVNQNNAIYREIILPYLAISLVCLLYISRQGLIATATIGVLFFLLSERIKRPYKILFALLIFGGALLLSGYVWNFLDEHSVRRLQIFLDGDVQTRSDNRRLEMILFGLRGFLENPLGHGVASFIAANPLNLVAHNFYVTLAYELGFLPLIFIVFTIFRAIKNLKASGSLGSRATLINIIVLSFFIQLLFIGALGKAGIFLIVPWVYFQHWKIQKSRKGALRNGY
jgi:hypothetical protein